MSKTTPPEGNYQERVASFVAGHDLETDIAARVLDLLSELGEVGGCVFLVDLPGEQHRGGSEQGVREGDGEIFSTPAG